VRKRLRALRAAGQVDDEARTRNLATHGGLRRGGRPASEETPSRRPQAPGRRKDVD
jgi:hypothetical protein